MERPPHRKPLPAVVLNLNFSNPANDLFADVSNMVAGGQKKFLKVSLLWSVNSYLAPFREADVYHATIFSPLPLLHRASPLALPQPSLRFVCLPAPVGLRLSCTRYLWPFLRSPGFVATFTRGFCSPLEARW